MSPHRAQVVYGCRSDRTACRTAAAVVQLQIPHGFRWDHPGAVGVHGGLSRVRETNSVFWICSVFVDCGAVYNYVGGQSCREHVSAAVSSDLSSQVLWAEPASGKLLGRRTGATTAAAE